MHPLPLFHEISQHHIRAQREPQNVQHEEAEHKARRELRRVLREARVEQREHHEHGDERYEPPSRAPQSLQGELRERCEDRPQDHRARCDEAAERGLEQGRQHKKRKKLRGPKRPEPPRPRQHDQPDPVISWQKAGIAADVG
jgi:hypothetical protein